MLVGRVLWLQADFVGMRAHEAPAERSRRNQRKVVLFNRREESLLNSRAI
jgi:hypothetical protein